MTKVLVLGGGSYRSLFEEEEGYEVSDDLDFDMVCFTGGTDINPDIYGDRVHRFTSRSDTQRDQHEVTIFHHCKKHGIPMVGICRGAQLLCALSGGKLYQHVTRHGESHQIVTPEGEMVVTSSHHQMMDVSRVRNVEVIGYASPRSTTYETGDGPQPHPKKDIEVAFFPETKALCHQPHPEWMDTQAPYRRFFFKTVKLYLQQEEV